jgi:hypothetical protein
MSSTVPEMLHEDSGYGFSRSVILSNKRLVTSLRLFLERGRDANPSMGREPLYMVIPRQS